MSSRAIFAGDLTARYTPGLKVRLNGSIETTVITSTYSSPNTEIEFNTTVDVFVTTLEYSDAPNTGLLECLARNVAPANVIIQISEV